MRLFTLIFILPDSAFMLNAAQMKPRITAITAQPNAFPLMKKKREKNSLILISSEIKAEIYAYLIGNRMAKMVQNLCHIVLLHDRGPNRMDAKIMQSIHRLLHKQ